MAEFFDYTDSRYHAAIKKSVRVYKWKLELLDYQDGVIREIVIDLDSSNSGTINSTNTQGSCRSCSFTFTNPNNKYSLIENNPFWDRRRFKLYIGLVVEDDIYWFSKGVYITKSVSINQHTISVQGVDKYGLLDGSLNVAPAFLKKTFKEGMKIGDIIRMILLQDIGNGMMLDATEPIIDSDIANLKLYKNFEMNVGTYYGALLEDILTPLGCDIYYDALGRLIVNRKFDDILPYWNFHLGVSYTFSDEDVHYQDPNNNYDFDGANYIVVETDDNSSANARYVLENHNPQSPVCVEKVGYKAYDNGNSQYINVGDASIDTPERKCREYAEYVLLQHTCNTITKTFNTPILPHLDARNTIRVSDDPMAEDGEVMLVTSLSIPFGVPNDMNVTASNIQWLLTDEESTSLTSEVGARSAPKYTISYSGTVKNANGEALTFPFVSDYEGGAIILQTSGKQNSTYGIDFGYFNADKLFAGWRDNMVGADHAAGSLFTIPAQNVEMTPEWQTPQKAIIKTNHSASGTYGIASPATATNQAIPEVVYFKQLGKYSNQLYDGGSRTYEYTQTEAGNMEIDFLYPSTYSDTTLAGLNSFTGFDAGNITSIDLSGMTAVTTMTAATEMNYSSTITEYKFPPNVATINASHTFNGYGKTNVTWPVVDCTITDDTFMSNFGDGSDMLSSFTVPSNLTIKTGQGFIHNCYIAEQLILECNVEPSNGTAFALTIPENVEDLQLLGEMHFASLDFTDNTTLTNIVIGEDVQIDSLSGFGNAQSFDITLSSSYITTIMGFSSYSGQSIVIDSETVTTFTSAFNSASGFDTFALPVNTQTVQGSFNSCGVGTLILNEGLTSLDSSFNGCTNLTSITIPSTVTTLAQSFYGCSSLTTMTILNPTLNLSGLQIVYLTKIRGYVGSTAEAFANLHNITFETIT